MDDYAALDIRKHHRSDLSQQNNQKGNHQQVKLENFQLQDQSKSDYDVKNQDESYQQSQRPLYNKMNARVLSLFLKAVYVNRFVNVLQRNKQNFHSMKSTHFNFINDLASDHSVIQKQRTSIESQSFYKKIFIGNRQLNNISNCIEAVLVDLKRLLMKFLLNIELIQPESKKKYYWDHLALIFRLMLLYIIPLEICYEINILFTNIWLSTSIILVIILDLLVRLNTLCFMNGSVITDRVEIIIYQIKKSLLGDILTIFVLLFYQIFNPSFKYFLVLTLYQYTNIYYFSQRTEQTMYLTKQQKGILNVFKLVARSVMILHVFSCIWFWISKLDNQQSWIIEKGLDVNDLQLCYLESFYFGIVTLLTIGYGDNVPQNPKEKIFMITFLLFACLWFSYSINFIGNIITDITLNQTQTNQKLGVLNSYFRRRKIPIQLQHKIIEYLLYRWNEDNNMDLHEESEILGQLPEQLKGEIKTLTIKQILSQSKFLKQNFSDNFNLKLGNYIQRRILNPGDTFSIQFDKQMCLCFIEDGTVAFQQVGLLKGRINHTKSNGLICVQDFICDNPQIKLFKALGQVSIITISKNDFLECLKEFPEDHQIYCQIRDHYQQTGIDIKNAVFCPLCMEDDHTLPKCKYVFYAPERESIIKKYCYPKCQRRAKYKRKMKNFHLNARENLSSLNQCAIFIQQDSSQNIECLTQIENLISESDKIFQHDEGQHCAKEQNFDDESKQFQDRINSIKKVNLYPKEINQIEILHAQINNIQLPQFEVIQLFSQYFTQNNFGNKPQMNSSWQKKKISGLLPYCFYPFMCINHFLPQRRDKLNKSINKEQQISVNRKSLKEIEPFQTKYRRKLKKQFTIQVNQILPQEL